VLFCAFVIVNCLTNKQLPMTVC